ncbi:MAG TPA: GntR family transcriptional regulator [Acidimicrobiia bacterium]|nr:GntR family transcriptional regulator [Acidimicrobiia bacterium]
MTERHLGIDDVYTALLERIGSGAIAVGSRLPSCRELAEEIGSNPSTVNRAIRRLARHGLVRTQPRRGTFLVGSGATTEVGKHELSQQFVRAITASRRAGLDHAEIRDIFEEAYASQIPSSGTVAFVECNAWDAARMTSMVENVTGVSLTPLLFEDFPENWSDVFDVIATPIFHLADLATRSVDMSRVVELVFVPEATGLWELATLPQDAVVAVVAPTGRGVDRMRSLVEQYFGGEVRTPVPHASLAGIDVVIRPSAWPADDPRLADVPRVIVIEWTLDPASAARFATRVASVIGT